MSFSLVGHASAAGANGATTAGINTTGTDLLIAAIEWFNLGTAATISDNKSNTWTRIGTQQAAGSQASSLIDYYYVAAPTVGSGHTFSVNGGSSFSAIEVQAWSGSAASPLDQVNQAAANQPGSVTPTQANELVVTGIVAPNGNSAVSINSGFTISDNVAWSNGVNEGGALAYLVQTTATAVNPTWTLDGGTPATIIATFKAATGGGATSYSFPNKGWVWNPQAETLTFNNASTHKQWVWNPQAPTDKFNIAASQKGWVWQANAPAISTLIITAAQKAWHWTGNAPAINTAVAAAQKAWHWTANAALTTLNLTGVQKALNWLGNAPLLPSAIAALKRALPWSGNPPKLTGGDLPTSQSLHITGGLPPRKKRSQPPE